MGDFDFKTWAIKGIKKASLVAIVAFATFILDYMKVTQFPAEFIVYTGTVIMVFELVLNWIKHTFLIEE